IPKLADGKMAVSHPLEVRILQDRNVHKDGEKTHNAIVAYNFKTLRDALLLAVTTGTFLNVAHQTGLDAQVWDYLHSTDLIQAAASSAPVQWVSQQISSHDPVLMKKAGETLLYLAYWSAPMILGLGVGYWRHKDGQLPPVRLSSTTRMEDKLPPTYAQLTVNALTAMIATARDCWEQRVPSKGIVYSPDSFSRKTQGEGLPMNKQDVESNYEAALIQTCDDWANLFNKGLDNAPSAYAVYDSLDRRSTLYQGGAYKDLPRKFFDRIQSNWFEEGVDREVYFEYVKDGKPVFDVYQVRCFMTKIKAFDDIKQLEQLPAIFITPTWKESTATSPGRSIRSLSPQNDQADANQSSYHSEGEVKE
ncbi:MAG: hypothetical protein ACE5FT_06835, partial [Candidatus Nanoarchaeia archaeon]